MQQKSDTSSGIAAPAPAQPPDGSRKFALNSPEVLLSAITDESRQIFKITPQMKDYAKVFARGQIRFELSEPATWTRDIVAYGIGSAVKFNGARLSSLASMRLEAGDSPAQARLLSARSALTKTPIKSDLFPDQEKLVSTWQRGGPSSVMKEFTEGGISILNSNQPQLLEQLGKYRSVLESAIEKAKAAPPDGKMAVDLKSYEESLSILTNSEKVLAEAKTFKKLQAFYKDRLNQETALWMKQKNQHLPAP